MPGASHCLLGISRLRLRALLRRLLMVINAHVGNIEGGRHSICAEAHPSAVREVLAAKRCERPHRRNHQSNDWHAIGGVAINGLRLAQNWLTLGGGPRRGSARLPLVLFKCVASLSEYCGDDALWHSRLFCNNTGGMRGCQPGAFFNSLTNHSASPESFCSS